LSNFELVQSSEHFSDLPRLPRDEGGPVFAEPWQAQAFAIAVTLSDQGHFTWKEWAAELADTLRAAADRGEPDDGSRYYEYWLATLERVVVARGLADPASLVTRKKAWTAAYRRTPHGTPVELAHTPAMLHIWWLVPALLMAAAAYWIAQHGSVSRFLDVTRIPQIGLLASAGFGSVLGLRHALEPDHLAAVSTLMTGERSSAKAARLGACWGVGHTLTLLAAGALLVLFQADMPSIASDIFELGVVLLLVAFGMRAMYLGASGRAGRPTHSHANRRTSPSTADGRWTIARRPLIVGAVHGLAGSGALTALVVATLPSTVTRLSYLLLFGIGTTAGMAVLSGVLGWPLARIGGHRTTVGALSLAVGSVSTALGVLWGYPIVGRLF